MPLVGKSMYVHEKRRRRHMPSRGFVDYRFGKAFGHQFDQLRLRLVPLDLSNQTGKFSGQVPEWKAQHPDINTRPSGLPIRPGNCVQSFAVFIAVSLAPDRRALSSTGDGQTTATDLATLLCGTIAHRRRASLLTFQRLININLLPGSTSCMTWASELHSRCAQLGKVRETHLDQALWKKRQKAAACPSMSRWKCPVQPSVLQLVGNLCILVFYTSSGEELSRLTHDTWGPIKTCANTLGYPAITQVFNGLLHKTGRGKAASILIISTASETTARLPPKTAHSCSARFAIVRTIDLCQAVASVASLATSAEGEGLSYI